MILTIFINFGIAMQKIILNSLVGLGVSVSGYDYEIMGSFPQFYNFKCGLGLERGSPALFEQLGTYLIEKQRIWLRNSTLLYLTERNVNHICYLPVSCRSIVDRCGSLGTCKPQIYFFIRWLGHMKRIKSTLDIEGDQDRVG